MIRASLKLSISSSLRTHRLCARGLSEAILKKGPTPRERPPPIKLTEGAANRIKEMLRDREDAIGIKIDVKKRGCNGYTYIMNYASKEDLNKGKDEIVRSHGVIVLVDPKAIFFIVGTVMNYEETELSTEFTFTNPNAKGKCGCGESFNI